MIKINLLGDEVQRDSSAILWIGAMVVSFIGFFLVATFMYLNVSNELLIRDQEVKDLERQLATLKTKTSEVSGLENKRKELNSKIAVIAELKLSKQGPVRVLDSLNIGVPERAWISDIRERGNSIQISGFALDGQTVASFMDELEESNYFADVSVETRSATHEGARIQSFVLRSKLSYAGALKAEKKEEEKEEASTTG